MCLIFKHLTYVNKKINVHSTGEMRRKVGGGLGGRRKGCGRKGREG